MVDAVNISLSGMQAEQRRAQAAANNIAAAGATGVPDASGDQPRAYTPQDVVTVTGGTGGVQALVRDRDPATEIAYHPDDPHANEAGYVALPNVSLDQELAAFKQAELAYKANAKALKVAADMQDEALRILDERV